jgi:hypothetical protein
MKRRNIVVLCLAIALATSAVVTASASALPEFSGPFPNPFTSTSKTTTLATVGKFKIKCVADTNKGEIISPTALQVRISLTGCVASKPAGVLCQSPNGVPGEIQTELLLGTLGYLNRVPKEVGLDLSTPTGAPLINFRCGAIAGTVSGSVIGKITPINKPVIPPKHLTLKFSQMGGKQKYTNFLGGPLDVLGTSTGGGPIEESGLGSTDSITLAAPVTIIA